jgi:hypothetical protein
MVVGLYSSALLGVLLLRYRVDWQAATIKAKRRITLAEDDTMPVTTE